MVYISFRSNRYRSFVNIFTYIVESKVRYIAIYNLSLAHISWFLAQACQDMRQLKDQSYTSCHMSFIYFPTQYDANFPNPFLNFFKMSENLHVVSYLGARETRKKHNVCQIVCHENNLKQLEFWFFGKLVFFILCDFVCFRKCYFLIKDEAIFFQNFYWF